MWLPPRCAHLENGMCCFAWQLALRLEYYKLSSLQLLYNIILLLVIVAFENLQIQRQ